MLNLNRFNIVGLNKDSYINIPQIAVIEPGDEKIDVKDKEGNVITTKTKYFAKIVFGTGASLPIEFVTKEDRDGFIKEVV